MCVKAFRLRWLRGIGYQCLKRRGQARKTPEWWVRLACTPLGIGDLGPAVSESGLALRLGKPLSLGHLVR